MNVGLQTRFQAPAFDAFGHILPSGVVGLYNHFIFSCLGIRRPGCHRDCAGSHPHSRRRVPALPHPRGRSVFLFPLSAVAALTGGCQAVFYPLFKKILSSKFKRCNSICLEKLPPHLPPPPASLSPPPAPEKCKCSVSCISFQRYFMQTQADMNIFSIFSTSGVITCTLFCLLLVCT